MSQNIVQEKTTVDKDKATFADRELPVADSEGNDLFAPPPAKKPSRVAVGAWRPGESKPEMIADGERFNGGDFGIAMLPAYSVVFVVSDANVAAWTAEGKPTCGCAWTGDYSDVAPAEERSDHVGI